VQHQIADDQVRGRAARRTREGLRLLTVWIGLVAGAQVSASTASQDGDAAADVRATIRSEAQAARALVQSDVALGFLDAAAALPAIEPRVVWRDEAAGRAFSQAEYEALPEGERDGLERREVDERFFYTTGYGTPVIYARPLELAAGHGLETLAGARVLDFGYGMISQLRMLAANGADVTGIEVEPLFRALYSGEGDQGLIPALDDGPDGQLRLLHGSFPGDAELAQAVGGDYDLILSKNVLKLGYIHPAREADERLLIDLGVDDESFLRAMHDALAPGGLFLVYNIAPAQNPEGEPYMPWADGGFPFERSLAERLGFEVLAFDVEDHDAIHDLWFAAGLDRGASREELAASLFAHWTLLRRAPAKTALKMKPACELAERPRG
jgi:SAM-dependent methyltransferase